MSGFYAKMCVWDLIAVGFIAQLWFVLHCFNAICFKFLKKHKEEKKDNLKQFLWINIKLW